MKVYHPNLQCDCEGCQEARKTQLFTGSRLLEAKTGMTSCYDQECATCKAIRTPRQPPPWTDNWQDSENVEQLKAIIKEQDRWIDERGAWSAGPDNKPS